MKIPKFRRPEYPDRWILTDFTMEQIERHIKNLEDCRIRLEAELEKVRQERDAAIKELSKWSAECGRLEAKLLNERNNK